MPRLRPHRQRMTSTFAAPLQAAHDLVFFDQRGAGRSTPSLACPGWHETFVDNFSEARTIAEDGARLVDAMRTCHERLANDGINFAAFTSAAIAADVGDLMAALGYPHWHLYGFSYGARVALSACAICRSRSATWCSTQPCPSRRTCKPTSPPTPSAGSIRSSPRAPPMRAARRNTRTSSRPSSRWWTN